jgi:hypothetical protein
MIVALADAIQQLGACAAIIGLAMLIGFALNRPKRNRRIRTIPPRYGFRGDHNGHIRVRGNAQ